MNHKKRNSGKPSLRGSSDASNMVRTKIGTDIAIPERRSIKRVEVRFFATDKGNEPVREWLKKLPQADRKIVGEDIMTVEVGWPIGMPTCDHIRGDLWEIRSKLDTKRIARTLFFLDGKYLVLTHSFIKKSQTTPKTDIDLALKRIGEYRS